MSVDLELFDAVTRPRYLWLAFGLTLIVFTVDTVTEIESAVAVISVLVVILVADAMSRRGIVTVGACFAILATIS